MLINELKTILINNVVQFPCGLKCTLGRTSTCSASVSTTSGCVYLI